MPIDQEMLRAERVRVHEANRASDFDAREKALIARDRAELAAQREAEQHDRELKSFASFCQRKAAAARNTDDAELWTEARENAERGDWTIARRISSDPEITAHQPLRTRLLYEGRTARASGE